MLDGAFHVDERSRLCCQIIMAPELDGLEVELAPESLADAPLSALRLGGLETMRTFPIFVSVDRKPPLVTGGGELAAIKTRLLLEARRDRRRRRRSGSGRSLPSSSAPGRVALIAAQPGVDQMRGRPLVIAATGDDDEDARVAAIARALGVPVNVPDKPALCSFVHAGHRRSRRGDGRHRHRRRLARARPAPARLARARAASSARCAGASCRRFPRGRRREAAAGRARRKFWEGVFDGAASRSGPCRRRGRSAPPDRRSDRSRGESASPRKAACCWSAPAPAIPSCSR